MAVFQSLVTVRAPISPSECSDPAGVNPIIPECWTSLNINQHVIDWWATYNATCQKGISFAQCFLEMIDISLVGDLPEIEDQPEGLLHRVQYLLGLGLLQGILHRYW